MDFNHQASDGSALDTGTILSWTSLHGLKNISKNLRMWTQFVAACTNLKWKLHHAKRKPYMNQIQIRSHVLLVPSSWENCPVIYWVKMWNSCGIHGHCVLWAKEERDQPASISIYILHGVPSVWKWSCMYFDELCTLSQMFLTIFKPRKSVI